MSKNQTPKPATKTYTYFDLDKMEKVEVVKEIPTFVPKSADEVLSLVSENNELLTKAVNAFLKRSELKAIKKEVAALGGSTTVVMSIAKPFRMMPPFNTIYELNSDGTVKVEKGEKVIDRKEQSKKIFEFIKSVPALVASIKAASEASVDSDDDDDETEETE